VIQNIDDLLRILHQLYPEGPPRQFVLLQTITRLKAGEVARELARSSRVTLRRLESLAAAADPIENIFGCNLASAASSMH